MTNIFISYRRADSADVTGRINDRLRDHYGQDSIFTDVDSIPFGIDFRTHLDQEVSQCKVLLAVIGNDWISAKDDKDQLRLKDPGDFVRIEIESALKRDIPVIPLLVQGAEIPIADKLPESLENLAFRNGISIRRDPDFHKDMDRLIKGLDQQLEEYEREEAREKELEKAQPVASDTPQTDKKSEELAKASPETVSPPKKLKLIAGLVVTAIFTLWLLIFSPLEMPSATDSDVIEDATGPFILRDAQSIAVLPFHNMSTSEEIGFFAAGLSEQVREQLAMVKSIKVTSFGSRVSGETDVFELARKSKVAYLLKGSVQQGGDQVRITTELISAIDGITIWSKTYEKELGDGFSLQRIVTRDIEQLVLSELKFDIYKRYPNEFDRFRGISSAAITSYLDAQRQGTLLDLGGGGDWVLKARLLNKAIEADPNFIEAYLSLANAYMNRLGGRLTYADASTDAHTAMKRAMELGADSAEALLQLGDIYLFLDLDYKKAKVALEKCLAKAPGAFWCDVSLARIDLREGRTFKGIQRMATASVNAQGHPQLPSFQVTYAFFLMLAGKYEQALKISKQAFDLGASGSEKQGLNVVVITSATHLGMIEYAESVRIANPAAASHPGVKYLLHAKENVNIVLQLAEAGIAERNPQIVDSLRDGKMWDPIRSNAQFIELLKRLDSMEIHTAGFDQ